MAAQRVEKVALVAAEKIQKVAEREAKQLENAAGRARCRGPGQGRAVPVRGGSGHGRGRGRAQVQSGSTESSDNYEGVSTEESLQEGDMAEKSDTERLFVAEDIVSARGGTLDIHETIERPRPRPRPRYRAMPSVEEEDSSGNER